MPDKFPSKHPELSMLVRLFSLGSVILVLALAGLWLDQKCHTLPVCTAIGAGLGVLYSFYEAWRIGNKK